MRVKDNASNLTSSRNSKLSSILKDPKWKNLAESLYQSLGIQYTGNEFNWDSKKPGAIAVMAEATGDPKYYSALAQYADKVLRIKKTPKGLVYVQKWGTNRHAANIAFIALQVS